VSTRRFSVVVHLRDTKKRAWVPVMGCSVSNLEWSGGENRNEAFFVKEVDANRALLKFVEISGLTSSMIQKLTSLWRLMKNFMDRVLLGSPSSLESKMIMTSIDQSSASESSTSQLEQIPPSAHDEPTDTSVPISVESKKVAGPLDDEIAWIEKKLDPLIVPCCCQSDPTIFNSFQGDLVHEFLRESFQQRTGNLLVHLYIDQNTGNSDQEHMGRAGASVGGARNGSRKASARGTGWIE
jgi:hypothetical protein